MNASKLSRFATTRTIAWLLALVLVAALACLSFRTEGGEIQVRFHSSYDDSNVGFSMFTVTNASGQFRHVTYKVFVREPVGWRWTGVQAGGAGLHVSPVNLQLRAGESSEIDVPVFERAYPWRLRVSYVRPSGLSRWRMSWASKLKNSMPKLAAMIQPSKLSVETTCLWGPEMNFIRPAPQPIVKGKLPTW